jgi:ferredoxin-nitrite reductase
MDGINRIEKLKRRLEPLDFEERLSRVKWENVTEEERFYLKNYGIYNIKLTPDRYMLRLRIDGGRVGPSAMKTICDICDSLSLKLVITARAQLEIHGLDPSDIYPVYLQLHEKGIETRQTLTDNFRAIVTDPFDGLARDSRIECRSIIEKISDRIVGKREWMGTLPRKFNTAFIGREYPRFNPWSNDMLFALSRKDGRYGFNLYLGGKNSETAESADIFITPEESVSLFFSVAEVFVEFGLRGSRSKTRLFHLLQRDGMDLVRERIEERFGSTLRREGVPMMKSSSLGGDFPDSVVEVETDNGIVKDCASLSMEMAKVESGGGEILLSPEQKIYIRYPESVKKSDTERSGGVRITACVGSDYCPLSLWKVRGEMDILPVERLERLGISVGFSGCLKGCGRHYHADIGLIGLRTNLYAPTERAARIFIGAVESPVPSPARLLYYSVPLRKLSELIDTILDDYEMSGYSTFEEFSHELLRRFSPDFLSLWYVARQLLGIGGGWMHGFFAGDEDGTISTLRKVLSYPDDISVEDMTRETTHRVWDL